MQTRDPVESRSQADIYQLRYRVGTCVVWIALILIIYFYIYFKYFYFYFSVNVLRLKKTPSRQQRQKLDREILSSRFKIMQVHGRLL